MWPDERWKIACCCGTKHIPSQNVQNTPFLDHFWKLRCWKRERRCGEARFQVKMYKAHQVRTTFGSWDVEKEHAVVARRTFPSQNVQSTPGSEHFLKLRCWKGARSCGAKPICKSKCWKHMKTSHVRTTFGCSDVVLHGRRKGLCTLPKLNKTWGFCSSFNYNHHYTTTTATTTITLHYTTLHYLHYTTLHYTTLHYTTLHWLHCTTPQLQVQLHYTTTTLRYATLPLAPRHAARSVRHACSARGPARKDVHDNFRWNNILYAFRGLSNMHRRYGYNWKTTKNPWCFFWVVLNAFKQTC